MKTGHSGGNATRFAAIHLLEMDLLKSLKRLDSLIPSRSRRRLKLDKCWSQRFMLAVSVTTLLLSLTYIPEKQEVAITQFAGFGLGTNTGNECCQSGQPTRQLGHRRSTSNTVPLPHPHFPIHSLHQLG